MTDTTRATKLRIRPGSTVWLSDPTRLGLLGPLPESVDVVERPDGASVALVIGDDAATVRSRIGADAPALRAADAFWVLYPKGNRTDVNRDSLWPILAEHGFRPISQVAVDDTWSALRFRPLRAGEAGFGEG